MMDKTYHKMGSSQSFYELRCFNICQKKNIVKHKRSALKQTGSKIDF